MNSKTKSEMKKNIRENTDSDELNNIYDLNLFNFISPLTFEKADLKDSKKEEIKDKKK